MSLLNQKTIKNPVSFSGVGLHSGKPAKICVKPSSPDTGIVFKRIDLKDNNLDVISYDNSEFNQKLLKEGLELVKTIIDEKYGSNVNISLVVDTEVEKIENKKNDKVNEDDIISLFDGKDML